jgi:hypothetical protein
VALYKAPGGGWQIRAGKAPMDADTRETMNKRTDWGRLLEPEELKLPDVFRLTYGGGVRLCCHHNSMKEVIPFQQFHLRRKK